MENNTNHNQHNGIGGGFLLGVIVGVLLTLLFTTKRGRAILKEVMEKGVEKFSNLEQLMRETEKDELIDEEFEEGNDFIPSEKIATPEPPKEKKETDKKIEEEKVEQQPKKETTTSKSIIEKVEKDASASHSTLRTESSGSDSKSSAQEEEKPKAPRNKRWFRGLRKKN